MVSTSSAPFHEEPVLIAGQEGDETGKFTCMHALFIRDIDQHRFCKGVVRCTGMGKIGMDGLVLGCKVEAQGPDQFFRRQFVVPGSFR